MGTLHIKFIELEIQLVNYAKHLLISDNLMILNSE